LSFAADVENLSLSVKLLQLMEHTLNIRNAEHPFSLQFASTHVDFQINHVFVHFLV